LQQNENGLKATDQSMIHEPERQEEKKGKKKKRKKRQK
jgi:hypothetical protein